MGKKEFIKKLVAGGFFVGCISMLIFVIFVIGIQRGFNEEKFQMFSLFRNIGGLNVGAPVRLSGVTVGTVHDIGFMDQEVDGRSVKVTMDIYKKFERQLYKCTKIEI